MPRWGIWITARDRSTGADTPFGIWQGDDSQIITVGAGDDRLFAGAQGGLQFAPLRYVMGMLNQSQSVTLNGASPDVINLTRVYDVQNAYAEIWLMVLDPQTGNLLDVERRFKGFVNGAPMQVPEVGGTFSTTLSLTSSMSNMTRTPEVVKSDADQRSNADDAFNSYGTVADAVDDPWGNA
jgi:hypothetical protein